MIKIIIILLMTLKWIFRIGRREGLRVVLIIRHTSKTADELDQTRFSTLDQGVRARMIYAHE